jgi:hypothetical protein
MFSECENVTMLISAAVDNLACALEIFSLKIGKNLGVWHWEWYRLQGTSYIRGKKMLLFMKKVFSPYSFI